jgi:hypothetical protein
MAREWKMHHFPDRGSQVTLNVFCIQEGRLKRNVPTLPGLSL